MPDQPPKPGSESASPAASPQLARSAGVIGAATMTSRVLGLMRDQVLAFLFGAGDQMDAYNIAFRIPNLVRDLFAEGAMSAAFVPTFTRTLTTEGRARAWRLGNFVVNALLLATGVIVAAGMVFAAPIATAFASAYAEVPGKLELTISLTRVMFPFLALVAVATALMGMLNSLHRFFIPAVSPAMFNVGSIVCTIGLAPVMPLLGWPVIMAPAIGVLVGGFGQMAVQWPSLRREGYRYRPELDIGDEGLRRVLALMGPGVVGLAAVQINLFVNSILATGEGTSAVSALSYAFRLMYMPIGIFGVSIATAVVPVLSRQAARSDAAGMRETVSNGLRMMLMLNVPATIGLMVLATPIVALIFEHGAFTPAHTAATAAALAFYAPGLVGYSAVKIAVPSFYALRDSRTPAIVSARHGAAERRAQPHARAGHGIHGPGARHLGQRDLQRGRAALAAPLQAGRHRRAPRGRIVRPDRGRGVRHGSGGLGRRRGHRRPDAVAFDSRHGAARRRGHRRRARRPRPCRPAAPCAGVQRSPGDGAGTHAAAHEASVGGRATGDQSGGLPPRRRALRL